MIDTMKVLEEINTETELTDSQPYFYGNLFWKEYPRYHPYHEELSKIIHNSRMVKEQMVKRSLDFVNAACSLDWTKSACDPCVDANHSYPYDPTE